MSNTLHIACEDCKEKYWCGQTSNGEWYMYHDKDKHFANFLARHIGHKVEICDDYGGSDIDTYDFKNFSYEGEITSW